MARILYYSLTFLITTIMLFNFAGMVTSGGYLLDTMGITNPEDIASGVFYGLLTELLIGLGVGIAIGYALRADPNTTVMIAMASTLVPALMIIGLDIFIITAQIATLNVHVAMLIGAVFTIIYAITCIDWWRGFV